METMTLQKVMEKFDNQSDLARQLNVSRQAVSVWFRENRIPKLRQYEIKEYLTKSV